MFELAFIFGAAAIIWGSAQLLRLLWFAGVETYHVIYDIFYPPKPQNHDLIKGTIDAGFSDE